MLATLNIELYGKKKKWSTITMPPRVNQTTGIICQKNGRCMSTRGMIHPPNGGLDLINMPGIIRKIFCSDSGSACY